MTKLEKQSVAQLRKAATRKKNRVCGTPSKMKKAELIHFLREGKGGGQYKDKLGHYKSKDHLDQKRRKAYYSRHGPATNKNTPKYWSHKILW